MKIIYQIVRHYNKPRRAPYSRTEKELGLRLVFMAERRKEVPYSFLLISLNIYQNKNFNEFLNLFFLLFLDIPREYTSK